MGARSKLLCGTITGLIIGIAFIAVGALMLTVDIGTEDESSQLHYKFQGK